MTDLSALSAEELAEKVLLGVVGGTYCRMSPGGREALNLLRDRASERDQAVRQKEAALSSSGRTWSASVTRPWRARWQNEAEARADRLAAALEQIAKPNIAVSEPACCTRAAIARDALAASEAPE